MRHATIPIFSIEMVEGVRSNTLAGGLDTECRRNLRRHVLDVFV